MYKSHQFWNALFALTELNSSPNPSMNSSMNYRTVQSAELKSQNTLTGKSTGRPFLLESIRCSASNRAMPIVVCKHKPFRVENRKREKIETHCKPIRQTWSVLLGVSLRVSLRASLKVSNCTTFRTLLRLVEKCFWERFAIILQRSTSDQWRLGSHLELLSKSNFRNPNFWIESLDQCAGRKKHSVYGGQYGRVDALLWCYSLRAGLVCAKSDLRWRILSI